MVLKMAGEFIEFFTELFFGSGAWLGLILILAILFVVAYTVKYSSVIWILVLIFLTFEYWDQVGGEISIQSSFVWAIIICFVGMALLGTMFIRDIQSARR